jgi:hypothetical protein
MKLFLNLLFQLAVFLLKLGKVGFNIHRVSLQMERATRPLNTRCRAVSAR